MAQKQSTLCFTLHISHLLKAWVPVVLCIFTLILSPLTFAESFNYGPTKSGETLWKIAQKNLPNQSISIEQFVYAIYKTNPKAFQSGNINLLLKGVKLNLPNKNVILTTTDIDAKKQISKLQDNAKQVIRAKANSNRFGRQIRKHQKQLKKYRRNSRAWKRTYRKLARSKRSLAIANRKLSRLKKSHSDHVGFNSNKQSIAAEKKAKESNLPQGVSQKEVEATNKALAKLDAKEKNKENASKNKAKATAPLKQENQQESQQRIQASANEPIAKMLVQNVVNKPIEAKGLEKSTNREPVGSVQKTQLSSTSIREPIDWWVYLKENMILIGGIINGIILLFVLFKLFEKKDEPDFIR